MNALPPNLKGNNINLRSITPDDYKFLFEWHINTQNLHLWFVDRQIKLFEEFLDEFRRKFGRFFHTLFIIQCTESNKPLGMVYFYNANFVDKIVYICIYLDPQFTAQGTGRTAGYLACEYFFKTYGVRKIYAEVFEYNQPSLKIATRNGFMEEAQLKEYRWFDDRYWNLHILSLSYEDFKKLPVPFE